MKKWVLYIMSIVFCMGFFACTAEDDLTDNSAGKSNEENVLVSFNLNIPSTRASSESEFDPNYEWERYIDATDIRVFVFKDNIYQEEVKGLFLDGNDGDDTRTLTGRVKSSYNGNPVNLVVLTGMKNRGVNEPSLESGTTTAKKLYEQLIFNYGNEAWGFSANETKYIPMWGISEGFRIIEEDKINDAGIITMYRAVAKINITINNGDGIDNFIIKEVKLCSVPNQGYCASLNTPNASDKQFEKPSLPTRMSGLPESLTVYTDENGNKHTKRIENKIYVPEMGYNDFGYNTPYDFHILIKATNSGIEQEYKIYMREEQGNYKTSFEIIRNHIYKININSLTPDGFFKFTYEAIPWGISNVYIPGFD